MRQFWFDGVVGVNESFCGSHHVIHVICDIPDEYVKHVETVNTMACGDDPRLMHDASAARKARKRFLALAAEDFHGVKKFLLDWKAVEYFECLVLAVGFADDFKNGQNGSEI